MTKTGTLTVSAAGDREIVMTRAFDAPRHLVFDAWTQPELVSRWLTGPDGWSFLVCEMDLRVGGKYRWVWWKGVEGTEMGMGGVYREIVAPERIVATEKFDNPWYPGEALVTTELTEEGKDRTLLTQTVLYESREARDAVLQSPMEEGVAAGYDRLDDVLASLKG